jgi:hypothetical protein
MPLNDADMYEEESVEMHMRAGRATTSGGYMLCGCVGQCICTLVQFLRCLGNCLILSLASNDPGSLDMMNA